MLCLFFRLEIPTGVAFSLVLDSVCSDTHRQSWERSINSSSAFRIILTVTRTVTFHL